MKTIIDIQIAPTEQATVTPCELLEDFADSTPSWHFLEEESVHYASLKGLPGCVLRQFEFDPYQVTDFAFSAREADVRSMLRLVLIDVEHSQSGLTPDRRRAAVERFLAALRVYLAHREMHAAVRVVEEDVASPVG